MRNVVSILVIENESQLRRFLDLNLGYNGYRVLQASTGIDGLSLAALGRPDLIVLDLDLPDMDGQGVLKNLRSWSKVPVIVLSVDASEAMKVHALDGGANDYVTKPFSTQELLARIRSLLRHTRKAEVSTAVVAARNLYINLASKRIMLNGIEVMLTPKEYAVLTLLAQHHGKLVTQRQLLIDIWGLPHAHKDHYVRIIISQLRKKLRDDPIEPSCIVTEAGVGYRLRGACGPCSSAIENT